MKAFNWERQVNEHTYNEATSDVAAKHGNGMETVKRLSDDPKFKGLYIVITYDAFFRPIWECYQNVRRAKQRW